jgi:putative spermidine/putrescine transport system ATP-binding protein
MMSGSSVYLRILDVSCSYGDVSVLQSVNLEVKTREFLTLLGPSGSGKSTLLMVLAGFVRASSGSVHAEGRDLLALPPNKRDIGIVFQNYALFPHMTVLENVLFPLRVRRQSPPEAHKRAMSALDRVGLCRASERSIDTLSGGERQRVALARALVAEPRLVLMDEPLSALDRNLRENMQAEIRALHGDLGFTTIYVTHDQREAMAMADRIVIMRSGRVQQVDVPERIYKQPRTRFVATFMGQTNLLPLELLTGDGCNTARYLSARREGSFRAVVRAEDIAVNCNSVSPGSFLFDATLQQATFQGDSWLWQLRLASGSAIRASLNPSAMSKLVVAPGQRVKLSVPEYSVAYVSDD